jgi:hypothetical protein
MLKMPEVDGDLDLADIDTNQPVPSNWKPEQDELPFKSKDKNEGSND